MYVKLSFAGVVVSQFSLATVNAFPASVPARYSVAYCVAVQLLPALLRSVQLGKLRKLFVPVAAVEIAEPAHRMGLSTSKIDPAAK